MYTSCREATEAKVCPKCGQTYRILSSLYNGRFYAVCRGCGRETPTANTKEEAIGLWNQGVFEQQ